MPHALQREEEEVAKSEEEVTFDRLHSMAYQAPFPPTHSPSCDACASNRLVHWTPLAT